MNLGSRRALVHLGVGVVLELVGDECAEFGGQLVVTFASVQPCISCYGDGNVPEISGDGKMVRNTCFLCQGTKFLRSFKAY